MIEKLRVNQDMIYWNIAVVINVLKISFLSLQDFLNISISYISIVIIVVAYLRGEYF